MSGEEDDLEICPRCSGDGVVDCHCGGDLCVCENYGERDCPLCFGEGEVSASCAEKFFARQREMSAVLARAIGERS